MGESMCGPPIVPPQSGRPDLIGHITASTTAAKQQHQLVCTSTFGCRPETLVLTGTHPQHLVSWDAKGSVARASTRPLAAGQQAAGSTGTGLLPVRSGGSSVRVAACTEVRSIELMERNRGQGSLPSGPGPRASDTHGPGVVCTSPETLSSISSCMRQIAVKLQPPAAVLSSSCPPAAPARVAPPLARSTHMCAQCLSPLQDLPCIQEAFTVFV